MCLLWRKLFSTVVVPRPVGGPRSLEGGTWYTYDTRSILGPKLRVETEVIDTLEPTQ